MFVLQSLPNAFLNEHTQIKVVEARLLALLLRDQQKNASCAENPALALASASSMFKDILSAAVKEREEEEVRSMWAPEPDRSTAVPHVPLVRRGLTTNPSDPESSSRLVQLVRSIK